MQGKIALEEHFAVDDTLMDWRHSCRATIGPSLEAACWIYMEGASI